MDQINREYGRHVTVRHHLKDGQIPPREKIVRRNCVCASRFPDGSSGVTVCTEAMMPKLHRMLPRLFHLECCSWYRSEDPFFNRYPRSRTPKIYKVGSDELDAHLKGAQPVRWQQDNYKP